MKRTYEEKSRQLITSVKPTTLNLQPRGFAPPQSESDENVSILTNRASSENLLEKLISTPTSESSTTPIQRKPQNRLKANRSQGALIQAKLNIGEPNDKYEKEADDTASKVVQQINSPTHNNSVQKQESMEAEDEELQMKPAISKIQRNESMEKKDEELQMKSLVQRRENIGGGEASTDLESSIQRARGGGQALDTNLQAKMEQAMGADFSSVKVHTDSQSNQLNESIQAKAFTTGQDVFFRQGEYNPNSKSGQELIAHELTHVVQQKNDVSKKEANTGAEKIQGGLSDRKLLSTNSDSVVVQRALGVDQPVTSPDIHSIKQAGTKKVFIIDGFGGDGVVIKFEIGGAIPAQRHDATQELTEKIMTNNATRTRIDTAEATTILTELNNLKPPAPSGRSRGHDKITLDGWNEKMQGRKELIQFLGYIIQDPEFAFAVKLEKVSVGKAITKDSSDVDKRKVKTTPNFHELGRMAMLDVIVGNTDRFQASGNVNWENIDFNTAGGVLALDNFDPNMQLYNKTMSHGFNEHMDTIQNSAARGTYAETVMAKILPYMETQAKGAWEPDKSKLYIQAFKDGMESAVVSLKQNSAPALMSKEKTKPQNKDGWTTWFNLRINSLG